MPSDCAVTKVPGPVAGMSIRPDDAEAEADGDVLGDGEDEAEGDGDRDGEASGLSGARDPGASPVAPVFPSSMSPTAAAASSAEAPRWSW
ncbi:hypothetical protein GCM10010297_01390 [Streptomyces malachitofuscus]|nr:hypothetical protein GCM10010297_01390 [Streptomyces malachitofuscus]